MAIRVGGQSDLGPPFRKQRIGTNPYRGFSQPAPFDPRTGHYVPLVPDPGARLGLFILLEEKYDYLLCKGYDPYTSTYLEQVAVAKPFLLQRTAFDGNSITFRDMTVSYAYSDTIGMRVSSSGEGEDEVTETQRITPDYFANDVLLVARTQFYSEVTGSVQDATGLLDENGDEIVWVDLNFSGRAWAQTEDEESP